MVKVNLAGVDFRLDLLHEKNNQRFRKFMADWAKELEGCGRSEKEEEYVSWKMISFQGVSKTDLQKNAKCEFQYLLLPISDRLLKYGKCVIHGTAFMWRGLGFIFMGPSGIGKSTQYKNWKKEYGKEVEILNGDKPILEKRDDHSYYIYPSPWKGKEGWAGMTGAKLGGIIYLEQASHNDIKRLEPSEAAAPIFCQLFYSGETRDLVEQAVSFTRGILENIPIWRLKNVGDAASAILTHNILSEYFTKEYFKEGSEKGEQS